MRAAHHIAVQQKCRRAVDEVLITGSHIGLDALFIGRSCVQAALERIHIQLQLLRVAQEHAAVGSIAARPLASNCAVVQPIMHGPEAGLVGGAVGGGGEPCARQNSHWKSLYSTSTIGAFGSPRPRGSGAAGRSNAGASAGAGIRERSRPAPAAAKAAATVARGVVFVAWSHSWMTG